MVVAICALIAALCGTAIALPGKNTVDSGDIKNGQVKRADIRNNAVTSGKVSNGSLLAKDFKAGQLPAGATGPPGPAGPAGPAGKPAAQFWALIRYPAADPVVVDSSGGVTATDDGAGRTDVTFPSPAHIDRCAFVMTLDLTTGFVRKSSTLSAGSTVNVITQTTALTLADIPFDIAAYC